VYGNGDGGGGPLVGMLERLKRMENVDGLAKVKMGTATEFYENIERSGAELSSWKGELVRIDLTIKRIAFALNCLTHSTNLLSDL
jgi:alpha-mannosidase